MLETKEDNGGLWPGRASLHTSVSTSWGLHPIWSNPCNTRWFLEPSDMQKLQLLQKASASRSLEPSWIRGCKGTAAVDRFQGLPSQIGHSMSEMTTHIQTACTFFLKLLHLQEFASKQFLNCPHTLCTWPTTFVLDLNHLQGTSLWVIAKPLWKPTPYFFEMTPHIQYKRSSNSWHFHSKRNFS